MQATNRRLVATRVPLTALRHVSTELQRADGYVHTLAEIWQQPQLWVETARRTLASRADWASVVDTVEAIVVTGSGSSFFVGKCTADALQSSISKPVMAVESGELLMLGTAALPVARPLLVVSFSRSGDSPESAGLVRYLLAEDPSIHHLLVSCNPDGGLARLWGPLGTERHESVRTLMLDERCCDKSLVMTSSFTSMAMAALGLAAQNQASRDRYLDLVDRLAGSVTSLLTNLLQPLEKFAAQDIDRMIAVGSGALQGAALEVALKMLEMTDGRVMTRAETSLGLRHGPMCALNARTLLFLPLSSHPLRRAYQLDLLDEVHRKRLGCPTLIIGSRLPALDTAPGDLVLDLPGLQDAGDEWIALASVVAGQLLGFLRCRSEGLRPDAPALSDSISRVVAAFTLHN